MKKIRVGIIGCGKFGKKRLQACLTLSEQITIKAIVDPNPAVKKIVEKNNANYYSNYQKLLRSEKIDLVIVSTPNIYHAPIVIDCLKNNLHVLCEKPLATNSYDVNRINKAAKKSSALLKVGANHLFFPTVKKANKLLVDKTIGKILTFQGNIGTNGELSKNSWFWNKKIAGGGTLIDNGFHLLEIIQLLMKDFDICSGHISTNFWKKSEVEDFCSAILVNKKNQSASFSSSWTQWKDYLYFKITGTKGQIEVETGEKNYLTISFRNKTKKTKTWDFSKLPITSYEDEIKYFLQCISVNKQPYPNADNGLQIIKMIEAIYKSNLTKRWEKI